MIIIIMSGSAAPCEQVADEVMLSLLQTILKSYSSSSTIRYCMYFGIGPGTTGVTTPTRAPLNKASRPTRLHAATPPLGLVALSTLSMHPS